MDRSVFRSGQQVDQSTLRVSVTVTSSRDSTVTCLRSPAVTRLFLLLPGVSGVTTVSIPASEHSGVEHSHGDAEKPGWEPTNASAATSY